MRIDDVFFCSFATAGWGLEDTWTRMRQLADENATLGEHGSLS